MDMPMYQEAIAHYLSGIALAFGDRLFSQNAKRHTEKRMESKLEHVTALHYLAEAEQDENKNLVKRTKEYLDAMVTAKEYFRAKGINPGKSETKGLFARFAECFSYYKNHERFNNLPVGKKLAAAFGLEFVADAVVAVAQVCGGEVNALAALGESLYQGPSLFLGLVTGKGLLYIKDMFRSKEEKELDAMAQELTQDGKLLELVRSYSPTKHIEIPKEEPEKPSAKEFKEESKEEEDLSDRVGDAIVSTATEIASGVSKGIGGVKEAVQKKMKKRVEEREKRKKDLKSRYDDY